MRDAVERAGFIGVKLYPPVGFLPLGNAGFSPDAARGQALDQALRALYATCEAEEIPITAHASPGNEFALGYGQLAAPERWAPVLREFPNLRLNFGHFGHETGVGSGAQASTTTSTTTSTATSPTASRRATPGCARRPSSSKSTRTSTPTSRARR